MVQSAFNLLHPSFQEMLYRMQWTKLRPIQKNAIFSVFQKPHHLIISAKTAGGKTEAAFLPILSQIVENRPPGVNVLYIGPLKALINDQFTRLDNLCEIAEIQVFRWHGDVSEDKKKKFRANPTGILLITPESLESFFVNRQNELSRFFQNLSFIVIDEMHSFIGTERGAHLKSLLYRLTKISKNEVRYIGLSATFGDYEGAKLWLFPRNPNSIAVITDESERKEKQFLIKGYIYEDQYREVEGDENKTISHLTDDLISCFYGKTALIFINSKRDLEQYTDRVRTKLERGKLPDLFTIHHGSLSKIERESAETALKSQQPIAAFCSSTLEMGIDIGYVSRIGQVGSPWSVNSLIQRIGRSGRGENDPQVMIMFISEDTSKKDIVNRIYPELLQAIAMSELMFEEWCEPPQFNFLHYSTLIQQTLSIIAEHGGANVKDLYETLITKGTFENVEKNAYLKIIRNLGKHDILSQDSTGLLILGIKGEKIVRSFDFYSAFMTSRDYTVVHGSKQIGSVYSVPDHEVRGFLILAGKRWEIKTIDHDKREITVLPSKGGKAPVFFPSSGADIHPRIGEKMHEILVGNIIPDYLDSQAKKMLKQAQLVAQESGLNSHDFVEDGSDTYWFTWTGSARHRTLFLLGKEFAGLKVTDCYPALKFSNKTENEILEIYEKLLQDCPKPIEIASKMGGFFHEKYERFLPIELLYESNSVKYIDTLIEAPLFKHNN